ncbi:MAG: HAD-IIB family hydrolase [Oligoflexia bacterium]|nr:HAD-IIB family hydrolase [Oligoflexia bacterium]
MSLPMALKNAAPAELKGVRGVCLDIDDTLSTHGKLTAEAYSALWRLREAGLIVVPITGRPAGWCDHFARFWPVNAIVGENGAFTFFMEGGIRRRIDTLADAGTIAGRKARLEKLGVAILERFPHAKWASDQAYREYDLAIDVCEDVPPWNPNDVEELLALCAREGAHAKLSSIHVNAWFGDFDKRRGFEKWLSSGAPGCPAPVPNMKEWLFIGDSPNDEPMFAAFPYTVGVANLSRYLDRLKSPPRWITASESGKGFAEMADAVIAARTAN